MTFNQILLRERKARRLSQEELAARLQVSRQAVSKWETGDAQPDMGKLMGLAQVLELSLDELCGRTPRAATPEARAEERRRRPVLLPGLMLLVLAVAVLLLHGGQRQEPANALGGWEQAFTVSGLQFNGEPDNCVAYRFTPGISGEGITYQITFTASSASPVTVDVPCEGGVCAGQVQLDGGYLSYGVTVCATDGTVSRNLAVADNLSFFQNGASWNDLTQ